MVTDGSKLKEVFWLLSFFHSYLITLRIKFLSTVSVSGGTKFVNFYDRSAFFCILQTFVVAAENLRSLALPSRHSHFHSFLMMI